MKEKKIRVMVPDTLKEALASSLSNVRTIAVVEASSMSTVVVTVPVSASVASSSL